MYALTYAVKILQNIVIVRVKMERYGPGYDLETTSAD